jgi:hypothetical protein
LRPNHAIVEITRGEELLVDTIREDVACDFIA